MSWVTYPVLLFPIVTQTAVSCVPHTSRMLASEHWEAYSIPLKESEAPPRPALSWAISPAHPVSSYVMYF